ncbi:MAG: proteasome assembly chaperone family protein [Candidatus Saliniplasma sp.]
MSGAKFKINEERDIPEVDVLLAGFPGTGLIGGIASEQLINSLDLEQIASVESDEFPPTAVIFDGIPRRPVRIFCGNGFLLVKSDMVIPPNIAESLARSLIDWSLKNNIEEVIILDGIPEREERDEKETKIWGVLSSHSAAEEADKLDIEIIERGAISGISSSLLLIAHEKGLKAVGMLAEGKRQIPDPRASAALLERFAKYRDFDIDTSSLIESAEQLEDQYAQLVQQTKQAQDDMDKKSAHPPLYG